MKSSGWYRLAMAGAMAVVLLNFWLAGHALSSLFVAQGMRAHTLEVIAHARETEFQVSHGNASVRAYLLTGDPIFSQRYQEAKAVIDREVVQLRQLTADNALQQRWLDYLEQRILVKRASLDMGIAMRDGASGPLDAYALSPVLAESPDGGPSVGYCLLQIEDEEQRLLVARTRETNHDRMSVWFSFVGATLLDILLLGVAAELLIRTMRDRHALSARAAEIDLLNTELRAANDELELRVEQRTRELNFSNQELEAFSYSVSHDLRAPLRTVDGFSLALQEDFADKLNDEGRDYIERVRGGVQRMGSLIDALLQLSRVSRTEVQAEEVDLTQLSTHVFHDLQSSGPHSGPYTQESGNPIQFIAEPGVRARGDARLLRIALENLIGNAIKFTSKVESPSIRFGARPGTGTDLGQTVYFIQDNGAGFDMKYVDRLFTAFTRLHGDRDFKGSGIGLATVSRIIHRHHGTIAAQSEPGQGATFTFTLPSAALQASGTANLDVHPQPQHETQENADDTAR